MKRCIVLLVAVSLCFSMTACAGEPYAKYTMSFFGTFDTFVTIIGFARSQETFDKVTAAAQTRFERLHQVYDGYTAYEGVANLYALNQEAAKGPVRVEPELMELLLYCREMQPKLAGAVNIALGAVLRVWHDFREDPVALPEMKKLQDAAKHINFDDVKLDEESGTVEFLDPALKLDLGAVAKGYATEVVAKEMLASEMPSFIIGAGGNVRAGNPPKDGRKRWTVQVEDPDGNVFATDGSDRLDLIYTANASVVTSGDYQRYVMFDEKRYHHIISPETLMPADALRAVTVVVEDSGLADLLSTALFILPYDTAMEVLQSFPGAEAMWVLPDRSVVMTDGMKKITSSHGATNK